MKAKEWAARLDTTEDMGQELSQFINEIGQIAAGRGNTPGAIEGAVREQKSKFMAVCKHTTKVNPGLWPALMTAHGQTYMVGVRTFLRQESGGKRRSHKNTRRTAA